MTDAGWKELTVLTANINSWATFKTRWSSDEDWGQWEAATILLLQEHHLVHQEQRDDAIRWLDSKGWHAVFSPARTLQSGKSSGGVAICVRQRPDIGVTDPFALNPNGLQLASDYDDEIQHRAIGVKVAIEGMPPILVTSLYLQAAVGLNPLNKAILATAAHWQEALQLPTLIGGDFNVKPQIMNHSTFFLRSGLSLLAPEINAYRNAKTRSTIDYYLVSKCLADDVVHCRTLSDFPLKPHLPVELSLKAQPTKKIPVLAMAPKLPTAIPYGPRQEAHDWTELEAHIREGQEYITTRLTSQAERLQILDQCYGPYVRAFEAQICQVTDTPPRPRSRRGQPPTVKYVPVATKAKNHMKSWHALDKPLFWILRWTQDVLRFLDALDDDASAHSLHEELQECPQECR